MKVKTSKIEPVPIPLKYRPDIDGLRAIAVLSVIFFHTGVPGFSGGFVGVDIFFVISGFLITSIILKDIQKKKFSIANFYERRIRRIFPALFPVIGFSFVVGAYLFDADAFKSLGKSITATTLFSSNVLFWRESGYFAAPSLEKPLLHTWSLAVEEQFYIIFPLALVFIHRYLKSRYFTWILIAIILSLGASVYGIYHYAGATFYLVPTRAWELLIGSILAFGVLPKLSSASLRNVLSITGLGFIIYSVGFYTEATLFPGPNAITPVLGAWLIIYSNMGEEKAIVNKLLSVRPLVFIGLISYSLYLWHWPFVAFAKYLLFRPFNGYESAGIIFTSLAVSTLSWKYIEQPFRGKQMLLQNRKKLFALSGALMIVASCIGGVSYNNGSVFWPRIERKWYSPDPWNGAIPPKIGCMTAKPSFVILGDSHAEALAPALIEQGKKNNKSGFIITGGGTTPLLGVEKTYVTGSSSLSYINCHQFTERALDFIKVHQEITHVILISRWIQNASGHEYKLEEPFTVTLKDTAGGGG
ncbi:MAG: acyltransferase family protein [Chlorobiaceae bacterium]